MNHTTHAAATAGVPQVAETLDFSDELALLGGSIEVAGARRIRSNGFYNKADRKPAGWATRGVADYELKPESPILVKLVDGSAAVADEVGLAAYLVRTGQSA